MIVDIMRSSLETIPPLICKNYYAIFEDSMYVTDEKNFTKLQIIKNVIKNIETKQNIIYLDYWKKNR